jgi:CheY-like chemotaxis protein
VKSPTPQLPPVVLVDDDHDDLFLLSDRLRRANVPNPLVTFDKASDAMGFLKVAIESTDGIGSAPCVVITDVKMPGLDGFQLTGWIRAQPQFVNVPVVILSGANDPRDTARASKLGATAYYAKFPRGEALAAIIARASRPLTTERSPQPRSPTSGSADILGSARRARVD